MAAWLVNQSRQDDSHAERSVGISVLAWRQHTLKLRQQGYSGIYQRDDYCDVD